MPLTCIEHCARRLPAQRRGERRIEKLLAAAVAEFASVGYEAATMSSIAKRAGAPIGSLYQFFPNKPAVAKAVRTRQIENVQRALESVNATDKDEFVDRFTDQMVLFVEGHPAFLPLIDAPSSTRPVGPRHRLRQLIAEKLKQVMPGASLATRERQAELIMELNRAMMAFFARKPESERAWVLKSYRTLLSSLLPDSRRAVSRKRKPKLAGASAGSRS